VSFQMQNNYSKFPVAFGKWTLRPEGKAYKQESDTFPVPTL
jgi:hypothetical protein